MDFSFNDEQLAVSEAATGLFSGLVDPERITAVEHSDDRIDRDLWPGPGGADLLGLAVPEADGGAGDRLMDSSACSWRRRPTSWRRFPCGPRWSSAHCPSRTSARRRSGRGRLPGVVVGT